MKTNRRTRLLLVVPFLGGLVFLASLSTLSADPGKRLDVPVKGMVTMVDLGAKSCVPCKMMAPILEKLEKDYRGRAAIVFIDVRDAPDQAGRFGIKVIPTQVFFDKQGSEVFRHTGFMSEQAIVAQLKKMGVN